MVPEEERRGLVLQTGTEKALPDVIPPVRHGVTFADLHLDIDHINFVRGEGRNVDPLDMV